MSQILEFHDDHVVFYHTNPGRSGTPDFEHKAKVYLNSIKEVEPGWVEVCCPVPSCSVRAYFSRQGSADARELHERLRRYKR